MKFLISMILGLGLAMSAQAADAKRKVAQEKMTCVPMGVPFNIFNDGDNSTYTADELNMLRNSIYAQVGFRFKSVKVTEEMTKRGCLKTDRTFTSDSLQKVDKKNISLLKSVEKSLREEAAMGDFQGPWDKAAKSATSRTKLLTENYCYLSDSAGKYFGILYFADGKMLNGMMNLEKPSWADSVSKEERDAYLSNIAYKELDSTSASFVLDYSTKGSWSVGSDGQVLIAINSSHKNIKNAVVNITSESYKNSSMLDCKLVK